MACCHDDSVLTHSSTVSDPMPSNRSRIAATPLLAAFGHHLGGAEREGNPLAGGIAGHRDDPLGAQAAGAENRARPTAPLADDHDTAARLHICSNAGVVAGAHDVGQGEQVAKEGRIGCLCSPTRVESASGTCTY
jgi:hypothetical protein